jgi:protein-tyrosine phosphatase
MKNLKGKFQLKIKIPKNEKKEEEKSLSQINNNNNRISLSQITDNIYTSGYLVAKDMTFLLDNQFTHVINCSRGSSMESPNDEIVKSQNYEKSPAIKYLPIFLRDDPGADIINCFFKAIDFIERKNDKKNKKILIHCIEGISRAPAIIAGYLMWKDNLTTEKAIELIKSKRKCVDINLGFIIQLQKWENYLFSPSEKIQIFKLNPNIRLLEEKEIENENYDNDEYLIRYNYKLFYINNNSDTKGDNSINEIKNINIAEDVLFNEKNDKKEFIINVIKYDKLLFKNEQIPLFEIKNKNILNKESLEDILKNTF